MSEVTRATTTVSPMRRRWRVGVALLLGWTALVAPPHAARAQVRGLITGPGETAFPIAVTDLQGGSGEAGRLFGATLTRNLDLSGLFRVLDPGSFGDGGSDPENVDFGNWASIGARLLVTGRISSGGGDVTVEPVEPRFEDGFVMMLGERGPLEAQAAPQPPPAEAAPPPAAARDGETVIEAASLVRKFGDFYAVREVSFQVRRGEVFALLGPNGAGKSTTFRMLCGLLPATAGTLRVAGVNLRRAPAAARARIGYVSQKFSLYAGLSVRENLRFFSSAYGLWGRSRRRQIERMLGEFHLAAFAEAASGSLPPGYQQRLAMACALMHEPEILFLDEPTSGVDVLARREFWGRINALAERGVTVMVTTHYMEEAEYCDRLAIMSGGRVLAIGPPAEIRDAARGGDLPAPSMEDAFVRLIAGQQRREGER